MSQDQITTTEFNMSKETDNINEIKKIIENKTEKKLLTAIKSGKIADPIKIISNPISYNNDSINNSSKILIGIMKEGANEFEKKVGRPMTYSEMREMYG